MKWICKNKECLSFDLPINVHHDKISIDVEGNKKHTASYCKTCGNDSRVEIKDKVDYSKTNGVILISDNTSKNK